MKHSPRQITMDLAELQALESELDSLKKPATGEELTEAEHQEATALLLIRALQNPNLFRAELTTVDLGKYKAMFSRLEVAIDNPLRIKFVRTP